MDLRPGYREFAPPLALAAALACLWVRVVPSQGAPETRVLPDACTDLIWSAGSGAFVAGPDTGPVLAAAAPGSILVGARLEPGAGGAALGLPLSDLRDQRVAAADLRADLDAALPGDMDSQVALERVGRVAARLVAAGPPDPLVRELARRLREPSARVEALAGELGVSERHLRRRSHAGVGYGPKTLQRVLRFRRFLALADRAPAPELAQLALAAGYADQAHLTRECTRLAGLPPAALARSRAAA
jgi:AraC-like DNA-binding protein